MHSSRWEWSTTQHHTPASARSAAAMLYCTPHRSCGVLVVLLLPTFYTITSCCAHHYATIFVRRSLCRRGPLLCNESLIYLILVCGSLLFFGNVSPASLPYALQYVCQYIIVLGRPGHPLETRPRCSRPLPGILRRSGRRRRKRARI